MRRLCVIERELCKPKHCNYACLQTCPKNRVGEECMSLDAQNYPQINEELCVGCALCVKACERAGMSAIHVVNLPEPLKEPPAFRYLPSGFCLFRLPWPMEGKVVGLVGANGVGKSTALKILAGELKPNLGRQASFEEVLKEFRGTLLQPYFERLERGEIRVAFKPQRVDLLPKLQRGKVGKALESVDERKMLPELAKRFALDAMLEREFGQLSGGELQLVSIFAVVERDATLYCFDEPSSYLDVKQRFEVAKLIKELRGYVLVVDHDLAVLDYMADRLHLLYGFPGAYGIVSKPYGVKRGINVYLDGYVKEDNVRFRHAVRFETRALELEFTRTLLRFGDLLKRWDGFELEVRAGELHAGEVIGVLGPNAIGKTTFVKLLAGEIEPERGEVERLEVSHKPQVIDLPDGEVKCLIERFSLLNSELKFLIKELGIDRLMEKRVSELSGGELQKVAILIAAGKQHQLLLLDEPSAFLDVESRLSLVKLVRRWAEERGVAVLVVDHDLQFLDAVSNRLMIFEGIPGRIGKASLQSKRAGMNKFLASVGITFRRDPVSGRAKANKPGSTMDREQKKRGEYFYV